MKEATSKEIHLSAKGIQLEKGKNGLEFLISQSSILDENTLKDLCTTIVS